MVRFTSNASFSVSLIVVHEDISSEIDKNKMSLVFINYPFQSKLLIGVQNNHLSFTLKIAQKNQFDNSFFYFCVKIH